MNPGVRTYPVILGIAFLVLAGVLWRFSDGAREPAGPIDAVEERQKQAQAAIDRTLRRTAEESRTGPESPFAGEAPSDSSRPLPQTASGVAERPDGVLLEVLNEGYTLGAYHGRMRRAPLTGAPAPQARTVPDWLERLAGPDAILEQATRSGRERIFGVLQLRPRADIEALKNALTALGARYVGRSGEFARVLFPAERGRLESIAGLSNVLGAGVLPAARKVSEPFLEAMRSRPAGSITPVHITLMAPDPEGEFRRALSDLGAVVGAWDSGLRSYTANLPAVALAPVLAADYVMAVEPVPVVTANHGSAVPVMGADSSRSYDEALQRFTGITGSGIAVGVLDTGLNTSHVDIAHGRRSVCGASFVTGENWDLWLDLDGHGTHVFGTIAGAGRSDPLLAGMAPNVSNLRFGKVLSAYGYGSGEDIRRGMDYLARPTGCRWRGEAADAAKPLIVNMSLAATDLIFSGRGVGERKLDAVVYAHTQLYVVAQANSGQHGFSNYGTAKNSLAVGAANDAGIIAGFSSHGPTADGRLAPNVVGTGVDVTSAQGWGSRSGRQTYSGTSMASPSVAGVAALLMEARPEFGNAPALARARLMASAIRPDAWLASRDQLPADNTDGPGRFNNRYGLGLVSARTSLLSKEGPEGWTIGSASAQPQDGSYEYIDITVPENAARLDIVMTWDEQPADTLTRSVLNNLDLWADPGADCGNDACGEHVSRSRIDNVEWLLIDDPAPGVWRLKVVPEDVYGESVTAAVAWTIQRGDALPRLDVRLEDVSSGADSEYFAIEAVVENSRYVASGTTLHLSCGTEWACAGLVDAWTPRRSVLIRADGLQNPQEFVSRSEPAVISVGEVSAGEPRRVRLLFLRELAPARPGEEPVLHVTATSWNAASASASIAFAESGRLSGRDSDAPANDAFAASARITGDSGRTPLDLSLASREPGEPFVSASHRTAWFTWEPPDDGLYRFRIERAEQGDPWSRAEYLLFSGDSLAALDVVEEKQGNEISFFARKDVEYRLRIATDSWDSPALVLTWEPADKRPANDDLAYAEALDGESGTLESTNEGATLEQLEFQGGSAATVWYEWTAPRDGFWRFGVDIRDLVTRVFTGARIDELRLVSWTQPREEAGFPAKAGETYRISVASRSADASGTRFTLSWREITRNTRQNDLFENAIELEGPEGILGKSGSQGWGDGFYTVEPGEPAQTGIGTGWWNWTAPEDGRYTFRIDGSSAFRLSFFVGDTLEDLRFIGSLQGGDFLVLNADANTRYWIALGRAPEVLSDNLSQPDALTWGETPANDSRADAARIPGSSGAVTARLAYATAAPGDPRDTVGTDSVWWNWSPAADGWYRFRVDEDPLSTIVSIYAASDPGQAIATSERSFLANGRVEAYALVRGGERYDVRLSARPGVNAAASATLRWDAVEAPAFLSYRGALDALEADSAAESWRAPRNLAMTNSGDYLFASSASGPYVFRRDPGTGELSLAWSLAAESGESEPDGDALLEGHLWWNSRENRLFSLLAQGGYSFALPAAGSTPVPGREIELAGDDARFPWGPFQGAGSSDGRYFYAVFAEDVRLDVHRVDSADRFTLVQSVSPSGVSGENAFSGAMGHPIDLALSPDERHLYLVARSGLAVFSRDPETGMLDQTREILSDGDSQGPFNGLGGLRDVALAANGTVLFVSAEQQSGSVLESSVAAFDLSDDPANPVHLDTLAALHVESNLEVRRSWSHLWPFYRLSGCQNLLPHGDLPAVDVFCGNGYYVVSWNPESGALEVADFALAGERDRFGNTLAYNLGVDWSSGQRRQMASSRDGTLMYRATSLLDHELADAIHIFERAAAMDPD
ncbi:MAG: S8 family serine peptidase [Cenarchaeum sp. SB0669_bin_11]|nr:S8 family serine peptidase [Cenarchaeum sp. SB0669_bin_11]